MDFAEHCVFVKQSPPPALCPPPVVAYRWGPLLPKLRGQFAEFLQHHSLKRLGILYQSTCVGFGYGLYARVISWDTFTALTTSIRQEQFTASVTSSRPWNINQVPIDYACRPHLRDRLTLRGLTLRRNPWTYGDSVSRTVCRYSCQHSHFRYLQHGSRHTFTGLRNAPLLRDEGRYLHHTHSFGAWL